MYVSVGKSGEKSFEDLLELIQPESGSVGAVVAFVGLVRKEGLNGSKVKMLKFEMDRELALKSLNQIRERVLRETHATQLIIHHVIDELKPGQPIMYVLASAPHRREAFMAVMKAIDYIKEETPIWKKEITDKGGYWVSEDWTYNV